MSKRQEAAKLTKQKIIDAVRILSEQKRYDEITVDEITQAAGVAKGSFYVYFKRKEDVCAEIAYEYYQKIAAEIEKIEAPAREKLSVFLKKSAKVVEQNTLPIAQQWFRAVVAPVSGEEQGTKKLAFDRAFISQCLSEAKAAGELQPGIDPSALADEIVSEFYGSIVLWCMTEGAISFSDITNHFCDDVLPKFFINEKGTTR